MYQDLYSHKHAGSTWGSSFMWGPILDLTQNAWSLENGQWLVWSHNSSLHKCAGKLFCKKVFLEVIPKKRKQETETEFTMLLLQEICHPPRALTGAALGAAVNSKSKLKSFMSLSTQTLGWKLAFLSPWYCLGITITLDLKQRILPQKLWGLTFQKCQTNVWADSLYDVQQTFSLLYLMFIQ